VNTKIDIAYNCVRDRAQSYHTNILNACVDSSDADTLDRNCKDDQDALKQMKDAFKTIKEIKVV